MWENYDPQTLGKFSACAHFKVYTNLTGKHFTADVL